MTPRTKRFLSDHWPGLVLLVILLFRISLYAIPVAQGTVMDRTNIQNRREPANIVFEWLLPSEEVLLTVQDENGHTSRISVPKGDPNQPGEPYQYNWNHRKDGV